MNEAKSYSLRILQEQYTINSDESQEHINASAELVNRFMSEIIDYNKYIEHKKAAVLVALRMASRIVHLELLLNEKKNQEETLTIRLSELDARLPVVE